MAAVPRYSDRSACGCGCNGAAPWPCARRLVSYSLVADEQRRDEHGVQFELSLSSLRASNAHIPAVLFVHGALAPEIAALCSRFGVMVAGQGPYADRLAALSPGRGDAMARYPVLHKSLNFAELAAAGAQQVLCCDLDTIFLGDVALLFDRYAAPHVVAREEAYSARSIHGADRAFIDEPLLGRMAAHLGRAVVPPFNLGVVLYNHGVVAQLASIMATFVDDAWRLMTGLTLHGYPNADVAGNASFPWIADVAARASPADRQRALPFPSNNGWIVEEVAWWLALGALPGLTCADFDPRDAAQNGEVLATPREHSTWTLCHYYSHNLARIVEWLRQAPQMPSHAARTNFLHAHPTHHGRSGLRPRSGQGLPAATFER